MSKGLGRNMKNLCQKGLLGGPLKFADFPPIFYDSIFFRKKQNKKSKYIFILIVKIKDITI